MPFSLCKAAGCWPLKWYALECIYYSKFDSKLDVWSSVTCCVTHAVVCVQRDDPAYASHHWPLCLVVAIGHASHIYYTHVCSEVKHSCQLGEP